jgi:hypothetical protein
MKYIGYLFLILFIAGCANNSDPTGPSQNPVPDPTPLPPEFTFNRVELILDDSTTTTSQSFFWDDNYLHPDTLPRVDTVYLLQGRDYFGTIRFYRGLDTLLTDVTDVFRQRGNQLQFFYSVDTELNQKLQFWTNDLDTNLPPLNIGLNFSVRSLAVGAGEGILFINMSYYGTGVKTEEPLEEPAIELSFPLILR